MIEKFKKPLPLPTFNPKFQKLISVSTSNGMDHFGLVRPEFEGAWSTLTGLVILVGRNEMSLSI